jgi:hypothetical protein
MNAFPHMEYLQCDIPEGQLLQEYGRALARERRERRSARRAAPASRLRALVIGAQVTRNGL